MLAETEIEFADCPQELLASYAENGEGVDRAGGEARPRSTFCDAGSNEAMS